MRGPAVQKQEEWRTVGDGREARLRKDPASWVSALARKNTSPPTSPP